MKNNLLGIIFCMLLLSCGNNGNSKILKTDKLNTSNEIAGQQK